MGSIITLTPILELGKVKCQGDVCLSQSWQVIQLDMLMQIHMSDAQRAQTNQNDQNWSRESFIAGPGKEMAHVLRSLQLPQRVLAKHLQKLRKGWMVTGYQKRLYTIL